jgi:hypothetical protein
MTRGRGHNASFSPTAQRDRCTDEVAGGVYTLEGIIPLCVFLRVTTRKLAERFDSIALAS